jgi:hypothetical protein
LHRKKHVAKKEHIAASPALKTRKIVLRNLQRIPKQLLLQRKLLKQSNYCKKSAGQFLAGFFVDIHKKIPPGKIALFPGDAVTDTASFAIRREMEFLYISCSSAHFFSPSAFGAHHIPIVISNVFDRTKNIVPQYG